MAPAVSSFNVPIPDYLASCSSQPDLLVASAAVFRPRPHSNPNGDGAAPRILLLQRAATDYAPLGWEVPGGAAEPGRDATVLAAVARELHEESGLAAQCIVGLVDDETEFLTGSGPGENGPVRWRKVTFLVEVDVEESDGGEGGREVGVGIEARDTDGRGGRSELQARLSEEHCDYLWASEAEVLAGRVGNVEVVFAHADQKGILLKAFALQKTLGV